MEEYCVSYIFAYMFAYIIYIYLLFLVSLEFGRPFKNQIITIALVAAFLGFSISYASEGDIFVETGNVLIGLNIVIFVLLAGKFMSSSTIKRTRTK